MSSVHLLVDLQYILYIVRLWVNVDQPIVSSGTNFFALPNHNVVNAAPLAVAFDALNLVCPTGKLCLNHLIMLRQFVIVTISTTINVEYQLLESVIMDPAKTEEQHSWQQSCTYKVADAKPVEFSENHDLRELNYDIPAIGSVSHNGRKLTLHYSGRNAVEQPVYESDVMGQESAIDLKHPFLRLSPAANAADGDGNSWRRAFEGFIRRVLDISMSFVLLVVLSPALFILALIVTFDSRGPILFSQRRVGKDEQTFTLYKFRSMIVDAEQRKIELLKYNEATGPIFKIKQDPRITRCGRWMRRLSLDELPQLWNVLIGDMSFVGPRPALPSEVKEYNAVTLQRLTVKPGITGLSQVSGRSDLPFERSVRHDLDYIKHQCLRLDFLILLRTIKVVFLGHGAY